MRAQFVLYPELTKHQVERKVESASQDDGVASSSYTKDSSTLWIRLISTQIWSSSTNQCKTRWFDMVHERTIVHHEQAGKQIN